jgi:hypothetical protein
MDAVEMTLVRIGPSLGERLQGRRETAWRRDATAKLAALRQELEEGTHPEPWAAVELAAGLVMRDVCAALGLSGAETREVLGEAGTAYVEEATGAAI